VLETTSKGFGFLRNPAKSFQPTPGDPYVSNALVDRFRLKPGLKITGKIDPHQQNANGGGPRLLSIDLIEDKDPAHYQPRDFDSLTPIDPHVWLRLETGAQPLTTRVMDLLTPIGKGQRGLIVAPPRSGKTVLLQHIALAVAQNYPDMRIIVLLVDERPEEVTDMKRTVRGDVFASSSDQDSEQHVRLAQIVFERAKRLAEQGEEVFLLLDSLTRLARAYNKEVGTSGRTMTGGIDVHALEIPKRLFGAARVFEEGGSLTILGTALVETGSKMDDIIFQEFKGTGNMELVLDRKLADRRIYPAIDIPQSGTRKEEKLLPKDHLKFITLMRRVLAGMKPIEAMTLLVEKLSQTKSNDEFIDQVRMKW
jgi:transcription termination factor Rho